jgi:uncharacterized protein GlcG (DUF336 family)
MPATVTLEDARRVISAAENKAQEIGQPMNIAVVDATTAGGNMLSGCRLVPLLGGPLVFVFVLP